ncbi:hypothetical protein [Stappia indica]|uniref:hypothetical protein n=1 Tax=Stappia indica TaxID=538381 RepID=UPI001CD46CDA|nr:hypothetical protein [Stappia indica]MCA1298039.1 hypothetical protein [Stappia indica]
MGLFDTGAAGGLFGGALSGAGTKLGAFIDKNPMAMMAAGSALLDGQGWGGGARGFMQGGLLDTQNRRVETQDKREQQAFEQRQTLFDQAQQDRRSQVERANKTRAWFQQKMPEYADAPMEVQREVLKSLFSGQKPTGDMQEYEYARSQGFDGSFMDYQSQLKEAGATNVTVGGGKYGTIPQGFMLQEDEGGVRLAPIPGGPADAEAQKAQEAESEALGNALTQTDIITTAAQRAREAAKDRAFGAVGQNIAQWNPYSDAAEVARQTEVLKAQAKIENLNAMRRQSPTGGALGNVTEKESAMLAAKSGALDPASPHFERDLADFERTLLRTIHGHAMGDRIFEAKYGATQKGGGGYRILGVE